MDKRSYYVWTLEMGFSNAVTVDAATGFDARKELAKRLTMQPRDVMSRLVTTPQGWAVAETANEDMA